MGNFGGIMSHHQVLQLTLRNYGECSDWMLGFRKLWRMLWLVVEEMGHFEGDGRLGILWRMLWLVVEELGHLGGNIWDTMAYFLINEHLSKQQKVIVLLFVFYCATVQIWVTMAKNLIGCWGSPAANQILRHSNPIFSFHNIFAVNKCNVKRK